MQYEQYRTDSECRYYSCDINKHIQLELPRTHTCMNIDTFQYKRSLNIIRYIESKHSTENCPYEQDEAYRKIVENAKVTNKIEGLAKTEVYKITGDYPFNKVIIYSYITDESKEFTRKELDLFLSFNIDFYKQEIKQVEEYNHEQVTKECFEGLI